MPRWLVALLSVLGPVAVFACAGAVLLEWSDADDQVAERNAGRVVNGRVLDTDSARAMDRLMAARRPRILVLGPSYANTDIRTDLLAAKLGVSKDDFGLLSVPNTVGAHWYAILQHRVFAAGYRPDLVVVVSGLQSMLLATPLTESSFVNLSVQLPPEGDPVVDARVQRQGSLLWARLREQRGKVRQWLFDGIRNASATRLLRINRWQVRAALDGVFDDSRVDMRLHGTSMPVAEAMAGTQRYYTPDMLPGPDEGFVPVITELVTRHGARMVWVRPPMSPDIPAHLDDVVLPGVQERTAQLVEEAGGHFVDMRALPMSSAMFKNEDHMNDEGSRRFSEALGSALVELDVLHPRVDPQALRPLDVTPASPDVAPGQRAAWRVAAWDPARGSFEVVALLEQPGEGQGKPTFRVTVDGRDLLLFPTTAPAGTRRWVASLAPPEPDGPFEVAVEAAADGPPVHVGALALGRRLGRTFLVGDAPALHGRRVPLLGLTKVVDGALVDESLHPSFPKAPVVVPGRERRVVDLPEEAVAAFETENWAFLSDEAVQGETVYGSRCSPLRVREDATLLPLANVPCNEVRNLGHGRSCHTLDRIFFSASDGSDPARNGRKYTLVLDEGRRCDGAAWLYPVDTMRLTFPAERVAELAEGARWLEIEARYLNNRVGPLHVVLTAGGRTLVDERTDGRTFKSGPRTWRLDPPILPDAGDVVLELENGDHVFYLLTGATLSERPPT